MAGSEKKDGPKADVDSILAEFDKKEAILADLCTRTRGLIEAILQNAKVPYQSVQFRVKSAAKLRQKYLDPTKNYGKLDEITDLAGLRVITYYEADVDRVAEALKREFDVDLKRSVDKREGEPDRFGYSALNYVCRHLQKRTDDVEYRRFAGIYCEIQITSILRHAWSEIEHEWYDLKDAYPKTVKRRFYRTAALLELAESEFQDIRKQRTDYERSVAVRVEAKVPDIRIDAVSLRPFILEEPIVHELDESLAAFLGKAMASELPDSVVEARAGAATGAGIAKLQELRESLIKHQEALQEFVARCAKEIWPRSAVDRVVGGLCIYHLGVFLTSARGKECVLEFLKQRGISQITFDVSRQVALAQEISAKYQTHGA
jgi:putative GTP pyrophosphokinase